MIYVSVPKEIKEYEERIIGPLTWRQIKFSGLSVLIGVGIYFVTVTFLGPDTSGWLVIASVTPTFAAGFLKKNNLYYDEYFKLILTFMFRKQKLFYDSEHFENDRRKMRVSKKEKKLSRKRLESDN